MMRWVLSCVLAFLLLAPAPASAAMLTANELRRECTSLREEASANCLAFFRGGLEQQQSRSVLFDRPGDCTRMPLRPEDLRRMADDWLQPRLYWAPSGTFMGQSKLGLSGDRLKSCQGVPGAWTSLQLRDACRADANAECRYFITGVLLQASVYMRLQTGVRRYCFRRGAKYEWFMTDNEPLLQTSLTVPDALYKWMRENPGHGLEPAATGLLDALEHTYPCPAEMQKIAVPGYYQAASGAGLDATAIKPPAASTAAPDSSAPGR